MDRDTFVKIMNKDYPGNLVKDDGIFLGLQIIRKYLPKESIQAAEHDVIYSVNVDDLVEAGITEEDAFELNKMNWMIYDDEYMAYFV